MLERYNLDGDQTYLDLCASVKRGEGKTIAKQSLTRSVVVLDRNGGRYFVIYDKKRKQIATFLTEEMVMDSWGDEWENFQKEERRIMEKKVAMFNERINS